MILLRINQNMLICLMTLTPPIAVSMWSEVDLGEGYRGCSPPPEHISSICFIKYFPMKPQYFMFTG